MESHLLDYIEETVPGRYRGLMPLLCTGLSSMETVGLQHAWQSELGLFGGHGTAMGSLNATVEELARTNIPILLVGESGTGKDVYARALHWLSNERETPMNKITCGAMDAGGLRDEVQRMIKEGEGCGKTPHLFFDGIEELDGASQKALLGILPDGEHTGELTSRARVISATTRELEREVEAGRFRRELFFRINGACLRLPPLRERKEDIAELLEYFLRKHADEEKKEVPVIQEGTLETLMAYDWPGNIRELENLARKMVALGDTRVGVSDLRVLRPAGPAGSSPAKGYSLKVASRAASREKERELILEALQRTKWNRKRAARDLQISYKALLYKLKQIGATGTETQEREGGR